jgi:hypothetical protein
LRPPGFLPDHPGFFPIIMENGLSGALMPPPRPIQTAESQECPVPPFNDADLFDSPYDMQYVQGRIETLATSQRSEWLKAVEEIRKCAHPPKGVHVNPDARALAQAKMRELGARNRFRGR